MSSMAVCRRLKLIRFKRGWKNSAKLEAVMPQRKQSDEAAELTRQAQAQTGQAWMLVAHRSVAVPQMTRVFPRTALTLSTVALMMRVRPVGARPVNCSGRAGATALQRPWP